LEKSGLGFWYGYGFMNINVVEENNVKIAVVKSSDVLITDVQSALNFIATVGFETGCTRIILNKSAICNNFLT